jgi:hypothetical protein
MVYRSPQVRCLLAIVLFAQGCCSCSHPGDAALLAKFKENETKFEELRSMFIADSGIDGVWPGQSAPATVSEQRWQSYWALLNQLGVENGITRPRSGECEMWLNMSGAKFLDPSYKGLAYCSVPPSSLRDSLDSPGSLNEGIVGYRPIGDDWYIYFLWSH